ncbi:hypothetical protein PAAG_01031 [Paracoccidioides lutzii Pb01]|uniref:Riboflavin kinase n=1 Tax=Paracoccidioides lutzii (strain ATCC MYA-826 / Pb01) TaxID=502779 RepID=C1GR86_PARBA|nr:hypothetical protein PAAG_01031 [Paracoccidioides lutzii Pb01]EEH38110.1 hypothetical protein PAAG_01031 [Paracoccidioides lutzii Pb01]
MRLESLRDPVAGPESGPEHPFPMKLSGPVIKGFGRGSKELGIPTANIPPDSLSAYGHVESGVYYGVAALDPSKFKYKKDSDAEKQTNGALETPPPEPTLEDADANVFPCVLSIGYNPFYKNTVRSVEIHLLPKFTSPSSSMNGSPSAHPINNTAQTNQQNQRPNFLRLPDFYGTRLNLLVLGYIRPEYDYVSLEALVDDIRIDCEVARRSLERKGYLGYLKGAGGGEGRGVREARDWLRNF